MSFSLHSSAFAPNQRIPRRYTLDGENLSPPLEWQDAPEETRSFILTMEDPDAPGRTFRHWGVYHIMRDRTSLPEGIGHGVKTEDLGLGVNDFGHPRYDGPQPPPGSGPHHYRFRLAALDVPAITQAPKLAVEEIWKLAEGHVLAETELVATYEK